MVAIFHNIPRIEDIKRNYLFFDEIQTSESFFNDILKHYHKLFPYADLTGMKAYKAEFDFLVESEIIKPKEDIESKLLPEIGGFDQTTISNYLKRHRDEVSIDAPIMHFFENLTRLKRDYHVDIVGRTSSLVSCLAFLTPAFNKRRVPNSPDKYLNYVNDFSNLYSRYAALVLNGRFHDNNYFPLIDDRYTSDKPSGSTDAIHVNPLKWQAVNLAISKFPTPDLSVDWRQLMDFKSDPDSNKKLLGLKTWITDISKGNLTFSEMDDKLSYLLAEYTAQMEHHKIKYKLGVLETIIVPVCEVLENVIRLKFGSAAKTLFNLSNSKMQLFEAEAKFQGREVAYVYKIQRFF